LQRLGHLREAIASESSHFHWSSIFGSVGGAGVLARFLNSKAGEDAGAPNKFSSSRRTCRRAPWIVSRRRARDLTRRLEFDPP